ncbi:MAG TPA: winged helix-turn-helix domain-containing protein [Rhodanobacteraceae bacterium]|nr:winged helix-turn-helix domain-containing protein [Rhodanobacteraceae bacterium]
MSGEMHEFGEFRFIASARELWRGGQRVELPRRTFECIEHLIAHRDRAVGRDELVAAIFGRSNVSDAQLGQIVLRTRRAVDDDGNAQHTIRTVPGFGYRWVAETRTATLAPDRPSAHIEIPTPAEAPRSSGTRALAVAALALVVIAASLALLRLRHVDSPASGARDALHADGIVVLPIEVDGLREDGWVRLGAMDLVADRLREAGMTVPPSESVLTLLRVGGDAAIDAKEVRETTAARIVVRGRATHDASGWRVALSAEPAEGIAVPVQFVEHDAMQAARGATDLLLAALGHTLPADAERETAFDETLQRARAAMLANELDTARSILTASPELAKAPAQLNYRLAQVDFRAGQLDRAESTLDEVLALPTTAADPRFHAQVLNARGATRTRRGEFADGGSDYEAAIAMLTSDGAPLERGIALVGRGSARVAAHRFDEALADFGAARTALEGGGDALGVARVDANIGMLELYRGRPAEAFGYLAGAADRFQSFGALHELLLTLTGVVDAQLALLQRAEAWASVERGWSLRERVTDPDQRVDLMLNRAQVLLGFGRYHEADVLLGQAGKSLPSQNDVLNARARSLAAELAARRERWREAASISEAALAHWPAAGADADRAPLVRIRQQALLSLGESAAARALLDRARDVPAEPSDQPGSVADALAMADWFANERDADRADRWYRYAAASADRRGVPAEIVAVAEAYAPMLLGAGKHEEAATVIGRVASWSARDFDCALLQLRLFHALDQREPWFNALRQAQSLAGEREIPQALLTLPESERALRLTGT